MFARAVFAPGLRAAARAAPRASAIARPMPATATTSMLQRRTMASKRVLDNEVRRGFEEVVPFLKRIPVDVYPLVAFVSFVCCLGVFFSAKTLFTDKQLRLKPSTASAEAH